MAGTGVPPINIEGTAEWSSLSRMMNSKGIQFSKARTAGTSVKVFTNTPADYRQLVALLESIKRPFFTYQLKEDRMDQRVIRGLPREMSVNDIKEDLVSQGIADAVVQQLTSRTTKKPLPLFLVKTKMPEKLAEIQRLAMLTVSFERRKSLPSPASATAASGTGTHSGTAVSLNGALNVERTKTAQAAVCQRPPTGQRNAKCCLCGEGHPANYKGCSKAPKKAASAPKAVPTTNRTSYAQKVKKPMSTSAPAAATATGTTAQKQHGDDRLLAMMQAIITRLMHSRPRCKTSTRPEMSTGQNVESFALSPGTSTVSGHGNQKSRRY
ncbi:unnamed protein product [Acanthoscelides obtectus]|uniref:Pre-C2HC domain-containing protein n=1 Tax=Acanthoscelides obtectus TaxID=200917 RepID=A0A9P0VUK8_ACAOB|nr:unnamed protein product [Acanthoscelides obtectus]CAK1684737.1 hypothetical protein AOBTE_LOCUS35074 [Acanthoscelides obtectus]